MYADKIAMAQHTTLTKPGNKNFHVNEAFDY